MPIKYQYPHFNPQQLSRHNIDRMAMEEVPSKSFVLDIGCATGFMGKYLRKEKKCTVFGLDIRTGEAKVAKKNLDKMIIADIEKPNVEGIVRQKTKNKKFDVILATSLIEHLAHPDQALRRMSRLLKPNGVLILSTPNVAHWSMRLSLLKGRFDYSEYGILDNTHLHLFTIKTFRQLFEKNDLHIQKMRIDAEGGGLPRLSLALAPFFPNLFAYQILLVAKKRS